LAKVLKPDFSKAVGIAGGVRVFIIKSNSYWHVIYFFIYFLPFLWSLCRFPIPDPIPIHTSGQHFSRGSPKSFIALQWPVDSLKQGLTL
jgi:hypothetical protein